MVLLYEELSETLISEEKNTWPIAFDDVDEIKKMLNKLKLKASAYGNTELTYSISAPYMFEVKISDGGNGISEKYSVKAVDITIHGGQVKKGEYTVLAKIDHGESGNIVFPVSDGVEVKQEWYTTDQKCDHCHSNRMRNSTFIVSNDKTGEELQIGKSCLKEYTGIDPRGIINKYILAQYELQREMSHDSFTELIGGHSFYGVSTVIGLAMDHIKVDGYIKKEYTGSSTYSQVTGDLGKGKRPQTSEVEINEIIEFVKTYEGIDSLIKNCKPLVISGYTKVNYIGLLCYLPIAVQREIANQKEIERRKAVQQEEAKGSQHVGNVGDKITKPIRSAQFITSFETQYGVTKLYKFIDTEDNVYIWYASNYVDDKILGSAKQIMGTIKGHSEREGVKQTVLTRVKIG